MNFIGMIAGLAAFLSVWFGHVAVRRIEFVSPTVWLPATLFTLLGMTMEFASFYTPYRPLSAALGILGITLLFDAFELSRQQKRVKKGHAPANPNNRRHARFLADPNLHATTRDLLKREPGGHPFPAEEASTSSTLSSP